MKHLFVPYKLAVIAKEKGYNEPCIAHWLIDDEYFESGEQGNKKIPFLRGLVNEAGLLSGIKPFDVEFNVCAPMYQQLIDWFRKEYDIHIYAQYNMQNGYTYPTVASIGSHRTYDPSKNHYEALNRAIEEAFKLKS